MNGQQFQKPLKSHHDPNSLKMRHDILYRHERNLNDDKEIKKKAVSPTNDMWLLEQGFHIGRIFNKGNYSKIYYAKYRDKDIACKIINLKKADPIYRKCFLCRELKILCKIRHPFIINIVKIIRRYHRILIFMEHAGGGDLLTYINRSRQIGVSRTQTIFKQLSTALHYLHSYGIAHRDIKLENILLTTKLSVKLADFGFARECWDRLHKTINTSNTFCGSQPYAPPEILSQIQYNPLSSDVWSLGIILYALMCSKLPFSDTTITHMVQMQLARAWDFNSIASGYPQEARKLVVDMLDPEPKCRPSVHNILHHKWIHDISIDGIDSNSTGSMCDTMISPVCQLMSNGTAKPFFDSPTVKRQLPCSNFERIKRLFKRK